MLPPELFRLFLIALRTGVGSALGIRMGGASSAAEVLSTTTLTGTVRAAPFLPLAPWADDDDEAAAAAASMCGAMSLPALILLLWMARRIGVGTPRRASAVSTALSSVLPTASISACLAICG